MLSIIVAISNNNVIGKNNQIIWDLPNDKKYFKNKTIGHTIIMGRKTFESLNGVLENREHIVLTRNSKFKVNNKNVKIINSVLDLKKYINPKEEVFIIGGEQIYKLLIPYVKKMYITRIYKNFDGDAYFPQINMEEWKIANRKIGIKNEQNNLDYEFMELERIK